MQCGKFTPSKKTADLHSCTDASNTSTASEAPEPLDVAVVTLLIRVVPLGQKSSSKNPAVSFRFHAPTNAISAPLITILSLFNLQTMTPAPLPDSEHRKQRQHWRPIACTVPEPDTQAGARGALRG